MSTSILEPRYTYKPFVYPQAYDFWEQHQFSFWLWNEPSMTEDVINWEQHLDQSEKAIVGGILKGFAQTECLVNNYWIKAALWFPHPEITAMCAQFAEAEGRHAKAYNFLNEILELEEYDAFLQEHEVAARLGNLLKVKDDSPEDLARSLAVFSGFCEGVSLFCAFAVLLHFSRHNKLKGMGKMIEWSSKDECYSPDTEVLTTQGWVPFNQLTGSEQIAQFDLNTKEISFTTPSRLVIKQYKGKMIKFNGIKPGFRANVTENHDMVYKWDYQPNYTKCKAKELKINPKIMAPLAGYKTEGELTSLSALDRFKIALQADGSLSTRYTGALCGTIPVMFSFSKQRKIDRMLEILMELGFDYKIRKDKEDDGNKKAMTDIRVNVPVEYPLSKVFDWIDLQNITSKWAVEFVDELKHWVGYISGEDKAIYYSSTVPENLDAIQAICALGGLVTSRYIQVDDRSESYSDVHRMHIFANDYKRLGNVSKESYEYEGLVYCATVDKGTLVTRYDNSVSIAGNCLHSTAGIWLFQELLKEKPEINTPKLKESVYDGARVAVELEDQYLDFVFKAGDIPGLAKYDVQQFIRSRANNKLIELGYAAIFDVDLEASNKIASFFDEATASSVEADFFANVEANYSKRAITDDELDW